MYLKCLFSPEQTTGNHSSYCLRSFFSFSSLFCHLLSFILISNLPFLFLSFPFPLFFLISLFICFSPCLSFCLSLLLYLSLPRQLLQSVLPLHSSVSLNLSLLLKSLKRVMQLKLKLWLMLMLLLCLALVLMLMLRLLLRRPRCQTWTYSEVSSVFSAMGGSH